MLEAIEARRVFDELTLADFDHPVWEGAQAATLTRYWSGAQAPAGRHAEARIVWDTEAIWVRFVCRQAEPLIVSERPEVERKAIGLWDRDVCELFVAPDASAPENYFEFEAAPNGEWLDLAIGWRPEGRETDWQFHSGMQTATRLDDHLIKTIMRVPFAALGGAPHAGARWRANLFRCIGPMEDRGYLAWQPTHTEQPNFHVPQKFGWLIFKE